MNNEIKYYKLTTETKVNIFGITLFRLELTIDCKHGKAGEKGGWLESEYTKDGNARVSGNAWVYGDAQVYGDARVYGDAWEFSPLQIQGTRHYFNVCAKGKLKIGCMEYDFAWWELNFKEVGEREGYTEIQIQEYHMYIKLAIELSKLQ